MDWMAARYVLFLMTLLLTLSLSAQASENDASVKVKWGYTGSRGPAKWGQLDPAFGLCASGKEQSPINLTRKTVPAHHTLSMHYQTEPMSIVDDGVTELRLGKQHTLIQDGHGLQVNFHGPKGHEYIIYNGDHYQLVQFHLHSPSETQWHRQSFPLEIHFVLQGQNGTAVVVAVLVKGGAANPVFNQLIDQAPPVEGKEFPLAGGINPAALLPKKKKFYSFMGSLTTPPCTEGMQWVVMADTITASPAQIVKLRTAMGGDNARPIQPLNHRVISLTEG